MPIDFEAEARAIKSETSGSFYNSPLSSPNPKSLPSLVTEQSLVQRGGFTFWNFFGIGTLILMATFSVAFIMLLEDGKLQSNISQDVQLEPQIDVNNAYQHIIDNNNSFIIENKIYVDQVVCNQTA